MDMEGVAPVGVDCMVFVWVMSSPELRGTFVKGVLDVVERPILGQLGDSGSCAAAHFRSASSVSNGLWVHYWTQRGTHPLWIRRKVCSPSLTGANVTCANYIPARLLGRRL
jgi:hypothetical protein